MVVGHSVQPQGINAACDGKVWRIDVGLSAHYGGPLQVLQLTRGIPRVLDARRPVTEEDLPGVRRAPAAQSPAHAP